MKNSRFKDFIALTKPRLNFLALLTTLAGFYLGSQGPMNQRLLWFVLLGATAVAAGCGALNQWLEKDLDKRMRRTQKRPLPAGRLGSDQAFWFGLFLSGGGVAVLFFFVNELTAFLGVCALVSYILLYTPLKKVTSLCTLMGAVPGALPPVMGWTAAQSQIGPEGWILFWILFFWQMPHFLAIGWMYREDYAKAGFPMLFVIDPKGQTTGLMAVAYSVALLPVSLLPTYLHITGQVYFWVALVLGSIFIAYSVALAREKTTQHAKRLFYVSITYLPVLFLTMVLNKT